MKNGKKDMLNTHKFRLLTASVVLALTLLQGAFAQVDDVPTFAGTTWLSSPETVIAQLTSEGYTTTATALDENNLVRFNGTVLNHDALVVTTFNQRNQLVNASVYVITDMKSGKKFPTAQKNYESLKEVLITRYGAPLQSSAYFISPYEEGDGNEDVAIAVGKGTYSTYWAYDNGTLGLHIDEDINVEVVYETVELGRYLQYLHNKETLGTEDF
jgi:hypothetical protein